MGFFLNYVIKLYVYPKGFMIIIGWLTMGYSISWYDLWGQYALWEEKRVNKQPYVYVFQRN